MTRRRTYAALLFAAASLPASAQAFSDYELFALGPLEAGGGGGRFFTSSPVDGYGCYVCHMGGTAPVAKVTGLPDEGYVPGQTYNIEISWAEPQFPHALNLEFVTKSGSAGGMITLLDPSLFEPADSCAPNSEGDVPGHLIEESAPRQVLAMDDCGSSRLRFQYTAPQDPEVTFAASIVRTDASEKPEGDGTIEIHRILKRQGYATNASASGCQLAHRRTPRGVALGLSVLWLALVARLGRKKRALDA